MGADLNQESEKPKGFEAELRTVLGVRWSNLVAAIERLGSATSRTHVLEILRSSARNIVMADGIAIVLRDNDHCHYLAEDSCAPLWAGQRFPAESCVSGWVMRERKSASIPNVFEDSRVPADVYRSTFVKSMAMVPIGKPDSVAALGAYWAEVRRPAYHEVAMLETLARAAATALENVRLVESLQALNNSLEERVAERTTELEQANELLRQTQKLEVIGQLTGHVAHDFNNLLTPIIASLDLILHRKDNDERLLRNVTRAMDAAERARLLVQRLLAFARRQPLRTSPIAIDKLILGMKDLLNSTLGPQITIDIDLPEEMPMVNGDLNQLELAILNLSVNARDAMPSQGGTIRLSAHDAGPDRPKCLSTDEYFCIEISDDGAGMDKETMARAIEPFFSTKDHGQGTGLGLSMVDGLIGQLGGAMTIDSNPGEGTTIRLFLPVSKEVKIEDQAIVQSETPAPRSRGLVLMVDDEPLVRAGTAEMLLDLGFDVVEAETANHGLELIRKGLNPHIVVTDHLMPGLTGAEFARILKEERPDIPVLLVSGFQNLDSFLPDLPRLPKPFRQADLGRCIASLRTAA